VSVGASRARREAQRFERVHARRDAPSLLGEREPLASSPGVREAGFVQPREQIGLRVGAARG
jgi:hypothetical protein